MKEKNSNEISSILGDSWHLKNQVCLFKEKTVQIFVSNIGMKRIPPSQQASTRFYVMKIFLEEKKKEISRKVYLVVILCYNMLSSIFDTVKAMRQS